MTLDEVADYIDNMHLDDLDIEIAYQADGFTINAATAAGSWVEDIGSSWEVPDNAGGNGTRAFAAGPWTAYQYDAHYVTPRRDNYQAALEALAAGELSAVILGCTAVEEAWIFAIQTRG